MPRVEVENEKEQQITLLGPYISVICMCETGCLFLLQKLFPLLNCCFLPSTDRAFVGFGMGTYRAPVEAAMPGIWHVMRCAALKQQSSHEHDTVVPRPT